MAILDGGTDTPGQANVDASFNLQVAGPGRTAAGTVRGGGEAAGAAAVIFSENDPGEILGTRKVLSPETDGDFRLRVGADMLCDVETFNYTAQNTGKFFQTATTMTAGYSASGVRFNESGITTTATGIRKRTWAEFPVFGPAQTYVEIKASVAESTAPANTYVNLGPFRDGGANPFTPTDGAWFGFSPAGVAGFIVTNAGTPVTTGVFSSFVPVANQVYKFGITVAEKAIDFWINDVLYGSIPRPDGQGQPFMSTSLPISFSQAHIGGAAGGVFRVTLKDYAVSIGGAVLSTTLGDMGNRSLGSYQGLSGGTMGQLAIWSNTALATAAAATNTSAALGSGLGGLFGMNAPATGATDLIIQSYQNPAGTAIIQGRRLVVRGVWIACTVIGAAVATTETAFALALAFGHSAVSLVTAEAATTKAPRRIPLGNLSWAVGAAIGAPPREGSIYRQFQNGIYINPGEFLAVIAKPLVGTATASEVFEFTIGFDYGWE